ncbi:hypothetical protein ACFODL_04375 [Phenylobacterium terrae]|uniref:Uncharacterized protein n=1 Tax=Phenylobacterium terrae TaxID=2665495 RepID=A0ABW4MW42_9CAUL
MAELTLSILEPDGAPAPDRLQDLKEDLERTVDGPVAYGQAAAPAGSKGIAFDLNTLVIGVLSSGAVVALVDVLKAHVQRGRTIIEVEGPGGKARIDTADARAAAEQIRPAIEMVSGARSGDGSHAASDRRWGE